MKTVWLEEHGTGVCSGSGYHLVTERKRRENTPLNPIGTHSHVIPQASNSNVVFCVHLPPPTTPLSIHLSGQSACLHNLSSCCAWPLPLKPLIMFECFPLFIPIVHITFPSTTFTPPPPSHPMIFLPLPRFLPQHPPCALQTSSTRTVCTVPLIDSIHGQTFTIEPQGGGDQDGLARGAWDWSMLWKRIPLGDREKKLRNSRTEPYRYYNTTAYRKFTPRTLPVVCPKVCTFIPETPSHWICLLPVWEVLKE